MARWVFTDPATDTQYELTFNPSTIGLPTDSKEIVYEVDDGDSLIILDKGGIFGNLSMNGTILTEAQYDEFVTLFNVNNQLSLVDHLSREFTVLITSFEAEREYSTSNEWLHRYSMSAMVMDVSSVPQDTPAPSITAPQYGTRSYSTNYGVETSAETVTITGNGVTDFTTLTGSTRGDFMGISMGLHWLTEYTQTQRLADIAAIGEIGTKWVHLPSASAGVDISALVDAVHDEGMFAIGRVIFTDATSSGDVSDDVADAVGDGFDVIEIGMEPNMSASYGSIDYSDFETKLSTGVTRAGTEGFTGAVIIGAMGPYGPYHTLGTTLGDGIEFITDVYGAAISVDGWGWHPYCAPHLPTGASSPGGRPNTHTNNRHGWRLMEEAAYELRAETENVMYAMEFGAKTSGSGSVPTNSVASHFIQAARRFTTLQYTDWEARTTTRTSDEIGVICFYTYRADTSDFPSEQTFEFRFNQQVLDALESVAAESVS